MTPARFGHVNLVARGWRALARFYADVLGCVPVPPERDYGGPDLAAGTGVPGARLHGVHLRLPGWGPDGPTLEVYAYDAPAPGPALTVNRPGFAHLAFGVDDVAARAAFLAAARNAVGEAVTSRTSDGRDVAWGGRRDPAGNVVELQRRA
jgi:catechol 2,3-dioxygenase-like lactoylglutathione lyase family enzyme